MIIWFGSELTKKMEAETESIVYFVSSSPRLLFHRLYEIDFKKILNTSIVNTDPDKCEGRGENVSK